MNFLHARQRHQALTDEVSQVSDSRVSSEWYVASGEYLTNPSTSLRMVSKVEPLTTHQLTKSKRQAKVLDKTDKIW
jgi:hypothetical protein